MENEVLIREGDGQIISTETESLVVTVEDEQEMVVPTETKTLKVLEDEQDTDPLVLEEEQLGLPETEPLVLSLDLGLLQGLSSQQCRLVQEVAEAVRQELVCWRKFPIELPLSAFDPKNQEQSGSVQTYLFQAPSVDELGTIALDQFGVQKKLNAQQLNQGSLLL